MDSELAKGGGRMKLTCSHERLSTGLAIASKMTAGASYDQPVIRNVALRAFDGALTVSATNVETRVDLTVPAEIEIEGAFTVEPAKLAAFLDVCAQDQPLTVQLDGSRLILICGKASARLAGIKFDDFPDEQTMAWTWMQLSAPVLRTGLSCVLHAAATADARPSLTGVEFWLQDDALTLSAADGFQIATWKVEGVEGDDKIRKIIPARSLRSVLTSLTYDEPVTLEVAQSGGAVRFSVEGAVWTLQTIDGTMPDFAGFLLRDPRCIVTYNRAELDRALRLCTSLDRNTSGKDAVRRALLAIGYDGTRIVAEDTIDDHSGSIDIPSVVESGEPRTTSLNATFLRDGLAALSGERIALEIPEATPGMGQARCVIAREIGPRNGHLQAIVQLIQDVRTEAAS